MSLRGRLFALTYDRQLARAEDAGLRAMRLRLLAGAGGDVLEIGGGTGANLTCYGPAVGSLTITERCAGTNTSRNTSDLLPVPANPSTCQSSTISVSESGTRR